MVLNIFSDYILVKDIYDLGLFWDKNESASGESTSNDISNNASNTALMAASKRAKNAPTVAGKLATLAAGVRFGMTAIGAKNVAKNMTKDFGIKNFWPSDNFIS